MPNPQREPSQKKQMQAVMKAIRAHRNFTVSAHVNPEGDALGSALSLASLIKRLGKKAVVANHGGLPKAFEFLPRLAPVLGNPNTSIPVDAAMIVDVPILSRVGNMEKLIRRASLVVNIDHHVSNHRFADVNWVNPTAASVGEMIYGLYEAFGIRPTRDEAFCMYVSLVTDTGSFRYMNTTPRVHDIASRLISLGVKPLEVSQDLFEAHSASDLKFLADILSNIRQAEGGKVAWLEVTRSAVQKRHAGSEILDELVNYPRSVKSAQVAFVLKESPEPRQIRVSFRSKGRIDVNQIARQFKGGGHMAASGCTIAGTLPQARAQVLRVVRQALNRS